MIQWMLAFEIEIVIVIITPRMVDQTGHTHEWKNCDSKINFRTILTQFNCDITPRNLSP